MDGEEFLEHHGIKGQKWGVRRSRDELARSSAHPPSEDFTKANESLKRVKSSGTRSLTNSELKDLNNRLQLETQFSKIGPKSKFKHASEFIAATLAAGATFNQVISFSRSPAGQELAKRLKK